MWTGRGCKRKGGPIENLELWKELDRAASTHHITWEWVRGHAGHPQNEYVDGLAVRAAKEQRSSGGVAESGFLEWLQERREKRQQYLDFFEFQPPEGDA